MGAVWLASLPKVLADAGLKVQTWPGWEFRSRSTGGYDKVLGIGVHHDAIKTGTSLASRCRAAWDSEWNSTRPVGALWVHTDGTWMVGAAGATNTQGSGGPYEFSKGTVPKDAGNRYMLSIEASNNGIGEVWPEVQQDAYVRGCAAFCRWLDLDPVRDVIAHFEWTPGRKVDPAGASRYATGRLMWNMPKFRQDVASFSQPLPPNPPPPEEEDEVMLVGYVRHKDHPAVYRQWSNGTKTWIKDGNEFAVYAFISGKTVEQLSAEVKTMPNNAWVQATGVIVGPIPDGVDGWGVPL